MKRVILSLLLMLPLVAFAQQDSLLQKYIEVPDIYQEIYLDCIENNPSTIITTNTGQYIGQVDDKDRLYGYGMFVNNDGSQITGAFRAGMPLITINMAGGKATVGGPDFYAVYSLTSGRLEYVCDDRHSLVSHLVDGEEHPDRLKYAFVSMRFLNGDQYVGETYDNKRHGYGIYYYASGEIWFGTYVDDVRLGYGVSFDTENHMRIGYWSGDEERRMIQVKEKKK